jgi:hypothetical protein
MTTPGLPPLPDGLADLVDELTSLLGDEEAARRTVAQMRGELLVAPSETVAEQHLAAMRAAIGTTPATPEVIDLRARRVRRAIAGTTIGLLALGATGGLAAAGVLPAPLQDALSRAARVVAIDLPRSAPGTTVAPVELPDTPGATAPGNTGSTPAQTGVTPTGRDDAPGATAPGRTGETPGATAPGQTGETPGATAPGQTGETPGATAPGQTGETPGTTAPSGPPAENPGTTAPSGPPAETPGATAPSGPPAETPGDTAPAPGRGGQG